MPRLPPGLFAKANRQCPLLSQLLPTCRTLESAQAELRWLKQHAIKEAGLSNSNTRAEHGDLLESLVQRRARGEPLQYILGSEHFGDLEIRCRPGVLIPRQDTASAVTYLVRRLLARTTGVPGSTTTVPEAGTFLPRKLRVLDLCTGSGCIPLLFHSEFFKGTARAREAIELDLAAVDISPVALDLATDNIRIQLGLWDRYLSRSRMINAKSSGADDLHARLAAAALENMRLIHADVFSHKSSGPKMPSAKPQALQDDASLFELVGQRTDILISNPPYISPHAFSTTTERSVRLFEPILALVPSSPRRQILTDTQQGDLFYPHLLSLAQSLGPSVFMFEVADLAQAVRVAEFADTEGSWTRLEIWRDRPDNAVSCTDPSGNEEADGSCIRLSNGRRISVRGTGCGRSVFGWRAEAVRWLGDDEPPG